MAGGPSSWRSLVVVSTGGLPRPGGSSPSCRTATAATALFPPAPAPPARRQPPPFLDDEDCGTTISEDDGDLLLLVAQHDDPPDTGGGSVLLVPSAATAAAAAARRIPRGGALSSPFDKEQDAQQARAKQQRHHQRKPPPGSSQKKNEKHATGSEKATTPATEEDHKKKELTTNSRVGTAPPMVQEMLNKDNYYRILGTTREKVVASQQEDMDCTLQKRYHQRTCKTHPDKPCGDRRAFARVAEGYIPRGGASSPFEKEQDAKQARAKQQRHHQRKPPPGSSQKKNKKQSSSEKATAPATEEDDNNKKPTTTTLPMVEEILNEDDYYKILGTTREEILQKKHKNVDRELKKLYRRRAVQTHPDKTGGDRRAFDKVAEAYEVLSDSERRRRYDRFGKRGVQHDTSGGGAAASGFASAEDLFRSFFGGAGAGSPFGGAGPQQQHPYSSRNSNRTARFQLQVTLEDLYFGKTVQVQLPGGNMGGSGKTVEVDIPRGALEGETITVSGAMDQDAAQAPGDLLLQLQQRPHATFARHGRHDLLLRLKITWSEALTGCQRRVRHLDGSVLHIVSAGSNDGDDNNSDSSPAVIRTGDVHVLPGRGMPKADARGGHHDFGDLYVQYQVVQEPPKRTSGNGNNSILTADERRELRRLLRKLEGKGEQQQQQQDWPFMEQSQQPKRSSQTNYHRLQRASRSDFERRARRQDRARHEQEQQEAEFGGGGGFPGFSPFGGTGQRFFWSSGAASNPFFGSSADGNNPDLHGADDDGETQCRQM